DFIVSSLQTMWSFLSFLVLATTILMLLDPMMGLVLAFWLAAYVATTRALLPRLLAAGRRSADERSILNGWLVDAFTNIMAVKLFDSGHRENDFVRDGMSRYLDAVKGLTRSITSVRSAVSILNGLMMAAVFWLAIRGWMSGSAT